MTVNAARLSRVISPLRRALLAAAREHEGLPDIPDAQIEVLRALPREAVSSPGELARTLGVRRSTISNLLATMERSGLIERRPRTDDRRQIDVVASEHAVELIERFDLAAARIVSDAAATLSAGDRIALESAAVALENLRDALVAVRRPEATTPDEGAA